MCVSRYLAAVCVSLIALLIGCSDSSSSAPEGQFASVRDILSVLEKEQISCENLSVRDAKEIEKERAAQPEYTPPPGALPIQGPEFAIKESGLCQFEGSPEILSKEIGSTVTVFEDDEHLKSIPEQWFPGLALIYGDNWEIQLSNVELTDRVAELLGGKIVPPSDMPFEEKEIAAFGPRCFFLAALPPGLEAAAKQVGASRADPDQVAQVFGESVYYLPQEVQAAVEENCRSGLAIEAAIRADNATLRSVDFEDSWMKVCEHAQSDPLVAREFGLTEGFSYKELGSALTDHFLEKTSVSRAAREDLGRRCGRGVKQAVVGDFD